MNNFTDVYSKYNELDLESYIHSRTKRDVKNVLLSNNLNPLDFLTLLSPSSDFYLEEMAKKAMEITKREFGKTIQVYTPLYISNYCENGCTYCSFNSQNPIKRNQLSLEEIERECIIINSQGVRHILLLTGGAKKVSDLKYIKNSIKVAKKYFDSISIEMYSMDYNAYVELVALGVDNLTIYQETYNKKVYKICHPYGEKSDYQFRLETPERGAKAGFRSINLGVLLGLSKPIIDFFFAGLHSHYIMDKYPGCNISMSFPRLRYAIGTFKSTNIISDKDFVKFLISYRLFLPKAGISISTREKSEFRDRITGLGVTKMSASSKTYVSGTSKEDSQFEICDNRSIVELSDSLKSLGFETIYKDWVLI